MISSAQALLLLILHLHVCTTSPAHAASLRRPPAPFALRQQQQLPSSSARQGLSYDACDASQRRCAAPRSCVEAPVPRNGTAAALCTPASDSCLCLPPPPPPPPRPCARSSACPPGERCLAPLQQQPPAAFFCASCTATVAGATSVDDANCAASPPPAPTPTPTPAPRSRAGTALSGETCGVDAECRAPRMCASRAAYRDGVVEACPPRRAAGNGGRQEQEQEQEQDDIGARSRCLCINRAANATCATSAQCVAGEACFRQSRATGPAAAAAAGACWACTSAARLAPGTAVVVDHGNCRAGDGFGGVGPPVPSAEAADGSDADADADVDVDVDVDAASLSPPPSAPRLSTSASPTPTPTPSSSASASASASTSSPSPSSAACVAADALLRALPRAALVFRAHRAAAVLCDARGSCATAAHVVVFRGAPMTMGRYCDAHAPAARCTRGTVLVNSPRLVRGLRVPSRTDGLQFTAFAARFGTRAEEIALSALVRAGW